MLKRLNRHQIAGRIVENPEYGSIPDSGIPTIKLRVVTDDGWYDTKKQEYVKRNTYHTVKMVNKAVKYMDLRKDDWVFVEGSKLTDSWEDRDGNKKYADFLRANIIVEIPDPWEEEENSRGRDSGSQRDDRRGGGRSSGNRGDSRDSGRDRDRGGRDRGRDERDDRDRDSRREDRRPSRRGPDDDIPF